MAFANNNDRKTGEKKKFFRKKKRFKKKVCRFCKEGIIWMDYKDVPTIKSFVSDRGKILSGRITGVCAKHQRQLKESVLRLRNLALLPYTILKPKLK